MRDKAKQSARYKLWVANNRARKYAINRAWEKRNPEKVAALRKQLTETPKGRERIFRQNHSPKTIESKRAYATSPHGREKRRVSKANRRQNNGHAKNPG